MAFVKDGVFNNFQNEVIQNYEALEKRVDELELLLKKSTGGVTVDEVVPEPEPEVVEEEVVEEDEVVEEESSSKSKKKK